MDFRIQYADIHGNLREGILLKCLGNVSYLKSFTFEQISKPQVLYLIVIQNQGRNAIMKDSQYVSPLNL